MAIEIEVSDQIGSSAVHGILLGTMVVRFDSPIENMHINALFNDQGSREANKAEVISAAKRLALRLAHEK
jgi:hypothetical protein